MEDLMITTATEAVKMGPVRPSTNTKLEDERLDRRTVLEQSKTKADSEKTENIHNDVKKTVEELSHYVEKFSTHISFSIDPERDEPMIIVKDKESGKVIRQIPPKEVVELRKRMEEIAGIIFDGRG